MRDPMVLPLLLLATLILAPSVDTRTAPTFGVGRTACSGTSPQTTVRQYSRRPFDTRRIVRCRASRHVQED